MKRTRLTALTALCAILLSGPMAASASAADAVTDRETVAAVERAAPPAAVTVPAPAAAGQLKAAATAGGTVTIPVDPAGAVALTGPDGRPAVRLGLPDTPQQGDAAVAADGTVTYDDPTGKAALAVQALPDGVRVQTVIAGPGAPTEYAYPLTLPPGGTLQPSGDGGFLILDAAGAPTAQILAPWAKDAAGNQVSTRYQQRGTTIVQIVDHRQPGITYPVVADPTVSLGWRIYVKYNKSETRSIAAFPLTDKFKYVAFLCGGIPNPYAAAGCGLYVYDVLGSVANTFKTAAARNQCVEMGYLYNGVLVSWKPYSC